MSVTPPIPSPPIPRNEVWLTILHYLHDLIIRKRNIFWNFPYSKDHFFAPMDDDRSCLCKIHIYVILLLFYFLYVYVLLLLTLWYNINYNKYVNELLDTLTTLYIYYKTFYEKIVRFSKHQKQFFYICIFIFSWVTLLNFQIEDLKTSVTRFKGRKLKYVSQPFIILVILIFSVNLPMVFIYKFHTKT